MVVSVVSCGSRYVRGCVRYFRFFIFLENKIVLFCFEYLGLDFGFDKVKVVKELKYRKLGLFYESVILLSLGYSVFFFSRFGILDGLFGVVLLFFLGFSV